MPKGYAIAFNIVMLIAGIGIASLFFNKCGGEKITGTKDTLISLAPPVITNYTFTNPTAYKETVIIYDSTKSVLSKEDSNLIVLDYLKRREYADSIVNDTSKIWYNAVVEKNALKKIDIKHSYRPKVYNITETIYKNSLFAGLAPGYYGKPSIGIYLGYETKQMGLGAIYDPFFKGGSLVISKRINFKK